MNEKDLEQLEKLLTRKLDEQSAAFDEKLTSRLADVSAAFDQKLGDVSASFDQKLGQLSASVETKLDAISEIFSKELATGLAESERRMETLIGVIEKKVDLVIESQQALVERVDRMELVQTDWNRSTERRISNVAADLATHKADPAAYRTGYSVKEEEEAFVYPEAEREV